MLVLYSEFTHIHAVVSFAKDLDLKTQPAKLSRDDLVVSNQIHFINRILFPGWFLFHIFHHLPVQNWSHPP